MAKAAKSAAVVRPRATKPDSATTMTLTQGPDEAPGDVLAKAVLGQNLRHGHVSSVHAGAMVKGTGETLGLMECSKVVQNRAGEATKGNLTFASAMLASQAVTLDVIA